MSDQTTITVSDGLESLPAIVEMAESYKLSAKAFAFTFRQIAMPHPHNEPEFVSCCLVAKEHGLNPLTKEIYFMRDKHGRIQAIVSVDGWIKKCNEHPQFDGMEFETEHDGDKLISMTVCIYRKDRSRPTRVKEYMAECAQIRDKKGPWDTHPNRMLRNRTLCQGARIAFGFAGIMDRDEFDQWQAMRDVTPLPEKLPVKSGRPELLDIPDIPDKVADTSAVQASELPEDLPDNEADETIADVDGFLRKLEDDILCCDSVDELEEIRDSNNGVIARLPKAARAQAEALLRAAE